MQNLFEASSIYSGVWDELEAGFPVTFSTVVARKEKWLLFLHCYF